MQQTQLFLETVDFFVQTAATAELPVSLAIPVLCIFQITLLNVQNAVQSGTQRRSIALHQVVRVDPAPRTQVNKDLAKNGHSKLPLFVLSTFHSVGQPAAAT